ncbi:YbdD/YjiX family protein [Novosphingobium sp. JCM 18896]|uniref:YbdD/YjiX family protein n=1 Tax=Novosphingobium sp. JCM 18896 TaxID=2989731 RepID=UPI00222288C0|nr:YbdD/YjiX family protein [Novosphingobium sp. JCM 18896]MCW1431728.1 YbdD/YjiX family protein [Novosphingobium sp. JCM 18896]
MSRLLARLCEVARSMVGQPSYESYLAHMKEHHPDREPMSAIEFFRDREKARYGSGGGRCC